MGRARARTSKREKKGVSRWWNIAEWRERESERDHQEAGGQGREIDRGLYEE